MKTELYEYIPDCPAKTSAANIMVRLIDGTAFRYRNCLDGLDDSFLKFKPSDGSMNGLELLDHIYQITEWLYQSFIDNKFKVERAEDMADIINKTLRVLYDIRTHLLDMDDLQYAKIQVHNKWGDEEIPHWYLINGPVADITTHVGQIASWRRMMGNPIPKANVFRGKPVTE